MNTKNRLQEFKKAILELASGNFNNRIYQSGSHDDVDALAEGINMLGEELKSNTVPKTFVEGLYRGVADMIIVLDGDKKIKAINKAVSTALFYFEEELIGKPFSLLIKKEKPDLNFDELQKKNAMLKELHFLTKSGLQLPVACTFSTLYTEPGEKADILVYAKDISYLKHTESLLRKTRQQLFYHIEHSPLAVIQWNEKIQIESWSWQAEELFGYTENEVVGKSMEDWGFIAEEDAKKVKEGMLELAEAHILRNVFICRNLSRSGKAIWCEWYNSIIFDEDGNMIAIMSLVHDISHRRASDLKI